MDLEKFKIKAARRKKKLSAFLDKLDEIVPENFEAVVKKADEKVWKKVDCTTCANCCKTMTPTYTAKDISRIAKHLGMTASNFKEKWLYQEEGTGDWMNKTQPCQFLEGNMCGIYDVRPLDCAEFPHHHKKPFDLYNETFKNNLEHCPATLTLVTKLNKVVERDYEW